MTFLDDKDLNCLFKLNGKIYSEKKLDICLSKLKLTKDDLIITSNILFDDILRYTISKKSTVLNVDDYGKGEPKEEWVDKILIESNLFAYKRVIAIGGGAVIDIAKLCVFGDGRNIVELYRDKLFLKKKRELIVLPTTCGTGSEVTSVSVVELSSLKSKLGLQLDDLFPDKAILIGELLVSLPYKTFALTTIDALSHAVESLLSPNANLYSDVFARSAIEGIIKILTEVKGKQTLPLNVEKSLIYSNMAGIAFSIAGCATMHALSFPLGANYHLAHGEAVYAVFAQTLEYYKEKNISIIKLESILNLIFGNQEGLSDLLRLLEDIYSCPSFRKMGINEEICDKMANNVFENQQRLLSNSPQPLYVNDLSRIYKNCINRR